ncbi:LOW QUALITY PROTEIN: hypothetical protein OSB04_022099, partial [Centaurea solstitialis]
MILHFLIFSVILIIMSPPPSSAEANCTRVCIGGGRQTAVQFPFGFSSGCEIRLNCSSEDGNVKLGIYDIQNLTRDHIQINLPAECDRPFEEIRSFVGSNFALTSRNGLLLEDCHSTLNYCIVSTSLVENHFNLQQCDAWINRSMNCYTEENTDGEDFVNLTRLENAGCKVLFSALTVDNNGTSIETSPVSVGFQSLQLGWWKRGDCRCHRNAGCQNVNVGDTRMGYRCHCNEGYDGDGFSEGSGCHRTRGKRMAIVMVVSSVVAFIVLGIFAFYAKKHRSKSKRRQGSDDTKLLRILNSRSLNFKYSVIKKATSCFDEANKLGQGGFGTVHKRLFSNHQHRPGDFYNEVNIISSVEHKNLVKLLGFSCLGPESILIYEYLPNRSLDHFIFDAVRGKELNWRKRLNIILGTAEGLVHLHENSKTRIIHRDIKAANILLDSRLCAKIADFGLARSFQQDKNHISTGIAGTLGYMAPEYLAHGQLTEKVDVYSYGVLLLEVVTGMPNRGIQTEEHTHNLVSIVWKHFKEGTVEEVFDTNMMLRDDNVKKEVKKVVQIGLLCTQEVPSLRPTMSMALQMLSNNIHPFLYLQILHFYPKATNNRMSLIKHSDLGQPIQTRFLRFPSFLLVQGPK